jgi:hypothetical protein
MTRWLCPVCHRETQKTMKDRMWHHYDSIRSGVCPGSGEPWDIAVMSSPEYQGVSA